MFYEEDFVYSTGESATGYYPGRVHAVAPCLPEVIIERLNPEVIMPTYASEGDSGLDVYAVEDAIIQPEETVLMKLGFRLGIPRHPLHDFGYRWEVQVRPRSGISARTSLTVKLGSVDNFYRGEVGVIMHNTKSSRFFGVLMDLNEEVAPEENVTMSSAYIIRKGDRFAQLVFNEVIRPLGLVEGKVDDTDRGANGFGSTGV